MFFPLRFCIFVLFLTFTSYVWFPFRPFVIFLLTVGAWPGLSLFLSFWNIHCVMHSAATIGFWQGFAHGRSFFCFSPGCVLAFIELRFVASQHYSFSCLVYALNNILNNQTNLIPWALMTRFLWQLWHMQKTLIPVSWRYQYLACVSIRDCLHCAIQVYFFPLKLSLSHCFENDYNETKKNIK